MSDPPPSRRKSCGECAKAKRKCGMELPRCRLCQKKNIRCNYPNRHSSINDINIPEFEFPWLDDLMRDPGLLPWSGGLQPQIARETYLSPDATEAWQNVPDFLITPEIPVKTTLARVETEAALHRFRSWPDKWLKEGKAPFIHPRLYTSTMPKPLQDAYAACAIYSTKTDQNAFVAFTVIEAKANELLRAPNQTTWSPLDLLAAVQALLIFQLIRLFDGDIRQRALAEEAEPLLEAWTEQLRTRTTEEQAFTTTTAPSWRSWIFGESVRRTVTMSIFLSGIYSLVKKGYCTLSDQVTANSFTGQKKLWDALSALEWDRARQSCKPYWIERMDFEDMLREGNGSELDDFGLVMIITYKGQDVVDHWMASRSVSTIISAPDFHQSVLDMIQLPEGSVATLEAGGTT